MAVKRSRYEIGLFVVLGIAVVGSTLALTRRGDEYKFFDPIISVKQALNQRYVDRLDESALQRGAIKGMIEALNDPFTEYVPPADKAEFTKNLTGEYVGIGASVNIVDEWLTIVSPLEDSPAFEAGLMAEDKVIAIDGESTRGWPVDRCIEKLMGQPGTPVKLTIDRKGRELELTIVRNHIKARAVKGVRRDPADTSSWLFTIDSVHRIAYIRLNQFLPGSAAEIASALRAVGADRGDLGGLVLDLRFNPGGLLNEAEAIADMFLKEGVIVSTKGRAFEEDVKRATGPGTLPEFPIAVLLNATSASASEVLAGALVDNGRAIVVGTRSFGKGLVQEVLDLPHGDGAQLKVTEQRYYLPSGKCIQRLDDSAEWGVDPTDGFYVPMADAELIEMLRVRRESEILRKIADAGSDAADAPATPEPDWTNADAILTHARDAQLSAAVRAVQGRIATGQWAATGKSMIRGAAVAGEELGRLRQAQRTLEREFVRLSRREEALTTAAGESASTPPDLWPDSAETAGGRVQVFDKTGKLIATLEIEGEDLERWLVDAGVKSVQTTPSGSGG